MTSGPAAPVPVQTCTAWPEKVSEPFARVGQVPETAGRSALDGDGPPLLLLPPLLPLPLLPLLLLVLAPLELLLPLLDPDALPPELEELEPLDELALDPAAPEEEPEPEELLDDEPLLGPSLASSPADAPLLDVVASSEVEEPLEPELLEVA
jgi:hypothetical protein